MDLTGASDVLILKGTGRLRAVGLGPCEQVVAEGKFRSAEGFGSEGFWSTDFLSEEF